MSSPYQKYEPVESPLYEVFTEADPKGPTVEARNEVENGVKVSLLGEPFVGKTSLVKSLCEGKMEDTYQVTIGVDVMTKLIHVQGRSIVMTFWDIAGNQLFLPSRHVFHSGSKAVILVYDVTNEFSFLQIQKWFDEAKLFNDSMIVALVGNKIDKEAERVVSTERAEVLAKQLNALFIESSAKTRENVPQLFADIAGELLKDIPYSIKPYADISVKPLNLDSEISAQTQHLSDGTVLIPRPKKKCCSCCVIL